MRWWISFTAQPTPAESSLVSIVLQQLWYFVVSAEF